MKAIINVPKGSLYSVFNGLTFEVSELTDSRVSLVGVNDMFPDNMVDFGLKEVIIVDIKEELVNNPTLSFYVKANNINLKK